MILHLAHELVLPALRCALLAIRRAPVIYYVPTGLCVKPWDVKSNSAEVRFRRNLRILPPRLFPRRWFRLLPVMRLLNHLFSWMIAHRRPRLPATDAVLLLQICDQRCHRIVRVARGNVRNAIAHGTNHLGEEAMAFQHTR